MHKKNFKRVFLEMYFFNTGATIATNLLNILTQIFHQFVGNRIGECAGVYRNFKNLPFLFYLSFFSHFLLKKCQFFDVFTKMRVKFFYFDISTNEHTSALKDVILNKTVFDFCVLD